MNYTISVADNNRLFRTSLSEGEKIEISQSPQAEMVLPGFGHNVKVKAEMGTITISDTTEAGEEKKETIFDKLKNLPSFSILPLYTIILYFQIRYLLL